MWSVESIAWHSLNSLLIEKKPRTLDGSQEPSYYKINIWTTSTAGKSIAVFWIRQTKEREISFTLESTAGSRHAKRVPLTAHTLTYEELLGVKEFARLILLQLVGFVHIRSQWTLPVNPSLAEALGVQSITHHPEQHPSLQRMMRVSPWPQRTCVRGREEDDLCSAVELVFCARRRRRRAGRRGDATSFQAAGGDLLHQRLSVVERHVQAVI